jgi:hypothetical protein
MKEGVLFVEWATPNTICTVGPVFGPPLNTAFRIHRPLQKVHIVRDIDTLCRFFPVPNRLAGAMDRTFPTDVAEGLNPQIHRLVVNQWKACENLT